MANPNKPEDIARILRRNKDRLLVFLKDFHNDKDGEYDVKENNAAGKEGSLRIGTCGGPVSGACTLPASADH